VWSLFAQWSFVVDGTVKMKLSVKDEWISGQDTFEICGGFVICGGAFDSIDTLLRYLMCRRLPLMLTWRQVKTWSALVDFVRTIVPTDSSPSLSLQLAILVCSVPEHEYCIISKTTFEREHFF